MTYAQFHEAVRAILVGRHASFYTELATAEHHPERIDVQWWIRVPSLAHGDFGPHGFACHSADPNRVLAWLRGAIRDEAATGPALAHAKLLATGGAPSLRRVK